jgi:putative SOS response-associated peptidase YedK
MCGRYTLTRGSKIIGIHFNVTVAADLHLVARFNIAPTQQVPVITASGQLELFRWGLIPHWSRDEKSGALMINGRAETLGEKPAFRSLVKERRCLIPADGFYEWRKNADGSKTPMYIRVGEGELFGFAGLWDSWQSSHGGEEIRSCTIITTSANEVMKGIHDRMPVIVPREEYGPHRAARRPSRAPLQ